MANEVSQAGKAADLGLAAILNRDIWEMIADKQDLRHTVMYTSDPSGTGSAVVKIPQVTFDEVMSAPTEAGALSNSTLGTSNATVTVARQALRYDTTDLFQFLAPNGGLDIGRLGAGIAMAYVRRVSALIMDAVDTATSVVGTSGAAMTVNDLYDAIFTLEQAEVPAGPYFSALASKQWTDLQSSIRGEGGANQFQAATAAMLSIKGQGFRGSWLGIDFYTTAQINNDGTDYSGGLWAMGAIAGTELKVGALKQKIRLTPALEVATDESAVFVEIDRTGSTAVNEIVGNGYTGIAKNEDARIVEIKTSM